MDMVTWLVGVLGTGLIASFVYMARSFRGNRGNPDVMQQILSALGDLKTTSEPPEELTETAMERLDRLERRMEVVHSDSLRYLQKAAAAEQRIRQRRQEEEEESQLSEEQIQAIIASQQHGGTNGSRELSLAEIEALAERG